MARGAAAEGRIGPIHTEVACAGTSACLHENVAIISPSPWHLNFMIECRDCGGIIEWPTSGAKSRAETIADIQAMLKTEREQSV